MPAFAHPLVRGVEDTRVADDVQTIAGPQRALLHVASQIEYTVLFKRTKGIL